MHQCVSQLQIFPLFGFYPQSNREQRLRFGYLINLGTGLNFPAAACGCGEIASTLEEFYYSEEVSHLGLADKEQTHASEVL